MARSLMLISYMFVVLAAPPCYVQAAEKLSDNNSTTNLTFMFITSFGQFGYNSSGALPAAEMALEDINNNPDVLPGYNLVYDSIRDSQCHRVRSIDTFFDGILSEPVKIAVIGCGCSVATEPVAGIIDQWNISQISYSSSSPVLSDRSRFRKYFRATATSNFDALLLQRIANYFNWSRIAIITQEEGLFVYPELRFREELGMVNITVDSRRFGTTEDPITTEDLFIESKDYRVFMINAYSGPAKQIICEAYKRNYTYPMYAWITYHWYPREWWTDRVNGKVRVSCTEAELQEFLDRVITLQSYPIEEDENATTDEGTTLADFEVEYAMRAQREGHEINIARYNMYDSVWVLALALNRTMTMVESLNISGTGCESMNGSLVPLHQFDYTNAMMGCLIYWSIKQTDMLGISGPLGFDENGTRIHTQASLYQYRLHGDSVVRYHFANFREEENYILVYTTGEDETQVYPSGAPPDGRPLIVIHTVSIWLVVVFYILVAVGGVIAFTCLFFNFIFRNTKLMRLSSPKLNYLIITGAIMMYVSVIFYMLPVTSDIAVQARCTIEHWLFTIGYSLAFGTVLAKMWRVYQIFNNPGVKKAKVYKDKHLFILILIITGAAVVLVLLETAVPYLRGSISQERDQEHPDGKTSLNISVQFYVLLCNERPSPNFYWQIFIFLYLAVLQIVGILLAFQTRKVKVHGLRDSKFIAAIIYISSIVLVVLALVVFALRVYINTGAGLYAGGVLVLTTTILFLIFIPKMWMLYQDSDEQTGGTPPSLDVTVPTYSTNQFNTSVEKKGMLEKKTEGKQNEIQIKALTGGGCSVPNEVTEGEN